jgi:hypothetical protein
MPYFNGISNHVPEDPNLYMPYVNGISNHVSEEQSPNAFL